MSSVGSPPVKGASAPPARPGTVDAVHARSGSAARSSRDAPAPNHEAIEDEFNSALEAILAALHCSRASILLFDAAGKLDFVAWHGLSAAYRAAVAGHSPWRRGERAPEPIAVPDVMAWDTDPAVASVIAGEGIRALLFVPLVVDGGVVGKFMVYFDEPHDFGRDERTIARAIARHISAGVAREQAQAELRRSEARYRAILQTQDDLVCRFLADGTIVFVNESYAQARGSTADELQGANLWDFVAEADRDAVRAQLDQLTPAHPQVRIENRFVTTDGVRWMLWTNRAIAFDANGGWAEAQSTGVDITERKYMEEALRSSEERFRTIVETTPECVKLVSAEGTVVHINSSGWVMLGAHSLDEVMGSSIYDVIAPEDRERFRRFNESVCAGAKGELGYDIINLRGERRHLETRAAPFPGPSGGILHLAIARDVTDRVRAEERAQRINAEFRALADNIHQLAWMMDDTGYIYWFNQRWLDYTGTSLEDVRGWGWRRVHHPEFVEQVTAKFRQHIANGEPWEDTFPLRGKDGEYRWFLSRALPIRDDDGRVVRWFGTNTDITERKVAEEQRAFLVNELNHRVKNTLATVQSLAVQTLRTAGDNNARQLFQSRLLALSRAHDLLTAESWAGAGLRNVVQRATLPFEGSPGRIGQTGEELRVSPKQALALSLVLHELATNAAKYGALSGGAGRVEISWEVVRGVLILAWSERGGPPVTPPARTGFGTRLIERSLAHDLDGRASLDFRPDGLVARLEVPLAGSPQ